MPSAIAAQKKITCKLCGTTDLRLEYKLGNDNEYHYYRCPSCKLINYDPDGKLDQTQYAEHWADPRVDCAGFRKANQTFDFLSRAGLSPGRMLEIGCGSGRVLHLATEAGWDVVGLELSEKLATATREALGVPVHVMDFLEGDTSALGEGFDLVTLAHVLEHLLDPKFAMERIASLLKPNGHVLLEFPNIDAVDSKWKRFMNSSGIHKKSYPEDWSPGHCQEFCRDSFRYLAEQTGFEVLRWETYSRNPSLSLLYRTLGLGNKAQVLARKVG